jgi:hypothetical protein
VGANVIGGDEFVRAKKQKKYLFIQQQQSL